MEREVAALSTSTSCYVRCLSSSCKTIKSCEKFKKVNNNELAVVTMTVLCQAGHNGALAPGGSS